MPRPLLALALLGFFAPQFPGVAHADSPAATAGPVVPLPPLPSPTPVPPPHVPSVTVYLEGDTDVALHAVDGRGLHGELVCRAPCGATVPLTKMVYLGERGMHPSGDFPLWGADGDRVTLTVSSASQASHYGKPVVLAVGGALAFGGLVTAFAEGLVYGANQYGANDSPNGVAGNSDPGAGKAALAGFAVAGAGAVVVVLGLLMPYETTAKQKVWSMSAPASATEAPRTPAWIGVGGHLGPASLPEPTTAPIVSMAF